MFEIDYDLLPLSPEEESQVAYRAGMLARRGKVPDFPSSFYGRVVVVNPNEGFTLHHVPDELRRPLRRSNVVVFGGSRPLAGSQIAEQILDAEQEQIYQIVIELHSDFPALMSFVGQLHRIRQKHPTCRIMVHGDLTRVYGLLRDLLGEKAWGCDLLFDNFEGAISLRSHNDLSGLLMELPRYPTFRTPFFSHLVVKQGNSAESYDLAGLKKLYRLFGVGHIEELDISGLLREKLIVLDLPLDAVTALQFREKRGDTFHAVKLGGHKVYSADFAEKGLLGREVPFADLEAVYRLRPGEAEEEILMQNVRTLRINCFDGHVSFLWKPNVSYIPLYEVKAMRLHPPKDDGREPESMEDLEDQGAAPLDIETAVITERGKPKFGDVRAGIRQNYLEQFYHENLARKAKLQRYAANLKIACLGPIAAQTLNLLKPYGLAKAVPSESVYYLCDSFEELPDFHRIRERMEDLRAEIARWIKTLFGENPDDGLDHEVIIHRLPVVREWAQGAAPPMEKLSAEQLDALYRELKIFTSFCEVEFRRVDNGGAQDMTPFSRLRECQQTSLKVKHLAALVGGRYGKIPGREDFPDFVFFGSEEDRGKNGSEFFLPGIALSEIFQSAEARRLFQENDFEFTVFLEEQMAIISYLKSQEPPGQTDAEFRENYFREKLIAAEEDLAELEKLAKLVPGQAKDSEVYQRAVGSLKEEHQAETEAFIADGEAESKKLEQYEMEYFQALAAVSDEMEKAGVEQPDPVAGDDYMRALDTQLVRTSKENLQALRAEAMAVAKKASVILREKTQMLPAYLQVFSGAQKSLFLLLQAELAKNQREGYQKGRAALMEGLNRVLRISAAEAAAYEANLRKRHEGVKEEYALLEGKIGKIVEKSQRELGSLRDEIKNLAGKLRQPLGGTAGETGPGEILDAIEKRLADAGREVSVLAEKAEEGHRVLEALRPLYKRKFELAMALYAGENQLAVLARRQAQAGIAKKPGAKLEQPLVPAPAPAKSAEPETLLPALEQAREQWRRLGADLADFAGGLLEIGDSRAKLDAYRNFQERYGQFRHAVKNKLRGQRALARIQTRLDLLGREREDLGELVENRMLPAQLKLAGSVYIPSAKKRVAHLKNADVFMRDLQSISFEWLQKEFFDRGVFRRFFAAQFCQGAHFGLDPANPLFSRLGNVMPGIFLAQRNLRTNLETVGYGPEEMKLTKLASERPAGIRRFVEEQHSLPAASRLGYLVLPATLTLTQGLELILEKEELFGGLPQLVLIFVTKFNNNQLTGNEALRDRYFRALRHNVILNVDDVRIVDNPKSIAERLVQETLGCAHDFQSVQFNADSEGPFESGSA